MEMLDAWTNVFAAPGKRTTGTKAQKYAITGPGWQGRLPRGVKELKSPTNLVWLIGHTYCYRHPVGLPGGARHPGPLPTRPA